MAINPYAEFLAGRDPLDTIRATPGALEASLDSLGEAGLGRTYAPGKWNVTQILCHLADVEIAWGFRLRQAIAEPHHTIQPFDQDAWAVSYAKVGPMQAPAPAANLAKDTFLALRRWNLAFLKTVPLAAYSKPVTHPERGTTTFGGMLETMAGHDLNHLAQLQSIAAN